MLSITGDTTDVCYFDPDWWKKVERNTDESLPLTSQLWLSLAGNMRSRPFFAPAFSGKSIIRLTPLGYLNSYKRTSLPKSGGTD